MTRAAPFWSKENTDYNTNECLPAALQMKQYLVRFSRSSDVDWNSAALLSNFSMPWGIGRPPTTQFRALWSPEHFHFRFDCFDSRVVLAHGATVRQRVDGSDRAEIFLATNLKLDPYYCLEIDARGNALTYRARHYRQFEWHWSCAGLETESAIFSDGYRIQGTIPLSTLRDLSLLTGETGALVAGVYRAHWVASAIGTLEPEWLTWAVPATPQPDFHVPGSFGTLKLGRRHAGTSSRQLAARRSDW